MAHNFNAGEDYFALESGTSDAVKVVSSAENPSIQTASGANTAGDAAAVDSYGETKAPSAEYEVVAELAQTLASPKITLGTLIAASDSGIEVGGVAVPVIRGGCSISTRAGAAPRISMNGKAVQVGATALRSYVLPAFLLSPRHRAQDFLSLCTIKKGSGTPTAADEKIDFGMEAVDAQFPVEITLAQPKGETKTYDLHGNMATVNYTMNWYAAGEPTIEVASTVTLRVSSASTSNTTTVNTAWTEPKAKNCPEGGYKQYTWQVSFPLIGYEVA